MKTERVVYFTYNDKEKAKALIELLKQKNIEFVAYDNYSHYLFKIKRSGKTWNEIYETVNSIQAVKYRFENAIIENGVEYCEIIVKGVY